MARVRSRGLQLDSLARSLFRLCWGSRGYVPEGWGLMVMLSFSARLEDRASQVR